MDLNGGPSGGKGLEDKETGLGLMRYDGEEEEPWLDAIDDGLDAVAIVFLSADSRALDRATFFLLEAECDSDSVLVKVRVKYVWCSAISHTLMIILAKR